jgi:hypothetical protein
VLPKYPFVQLVTHVSLILNKKLLVKQVKQLVAKFPLHVLHVGSHGVQT